ncbi:lytic murein transglycosylase B [bacterium endosymbiont of Bathymodiolus sp. 5 South]|jgi:membrane-bound lytic murein transglycosylase B|uniref:lytic murein transglycosylase B n=1 Tax=bacterium endosymbiont of Bathymodiolus sp. 5 South TaxID=1181670 RepID=UPI0010B566C6|nr:lytic murein transglycosylase B [bacterium endosymbiont of Bathymodiolus sp. 5 South]CAC9455731.1 Membrane-bound lytic murein transglycosylase B [uncultured Gammaproteobacteria bacterium]SHN92457.1 Membrane-bound lytic murein transglycosylase B precursor [bacterium endosymbiont of Bathymodiolus sp. 5 South]VVH58877.1 Membrane-bound lytic murein transglycosylase B precursor (EC [uncultured Gammaproteobacteria bacterium]VVH63220.1 Membrane-bound lytic murein transglycosylase B precursor (EC [u
MLKLLLLSILLVSSIVSAKIVPATYFKITQNFIEKMVEKHDFDKDKLTAIFHTIKFKIADKTTKKKKKKTKHVKKPPMSWDKYKGLFITENRIKNGIKFWQDNLATLQRAEKIYHVPAEIIVAILGVETNYGNKKGSHSTLKTLAKRAFGNYRRRAFYQKELEHFLLMTRENAIAPLSVKGSYAGAMGFPQFIASSYRHYAIDFNKDGKVDLFSDPIDAIGSIANYFDKHQWHDYGEIARPISLNSKHLKHAKRANSKPRKNAKHWRNKGLDIDSDINNKTKLAFIRLPQKMNEDIWLTFWNFYVLTRYNHDNRYAMAVYQLSEKLKQEYDLNNIYEQDTY